MSANIPDKCVCYIDDIVLPVRWTMIDSRNNKLYLCYRVGDVVSEQTVPNPSGTYYGGYFSNALETAMNPMLTPFSTPVEITYDNFNNQRSILLTDERDSQDGDL